MNATQKKFADEMAKYIQKHALKYNICVCSPILAQAILESGWGTSELATKANNYFGIKYTKGRCPTASGTYKKIGSEQKADGSYKEDMMTWCKFKSKEDCVIGYLDFINTSRYSNLKGVSNPEQYLKNIRADGYATSLKYVENVMAVIKDNNLTQYDNWNGQFPDKTSNVLYRVQVGAYSVKSNADDMLNKLKKAGFEGFIVTVKK